MKKSLKLSHLLLCLLLWCTVFTNAQTQDSVEADVQSYINSKISTYQIETARIATYRTRMQTESANSGQPFSKPLFLQAMVEIKKYDLRKKFFFENPNKLAVFNTQSVASPAQICTDGDFETWPIANPFVFKVAYSPINGFAQNIVTTGTDFVPFAVGTGTNNFNDLATLVSPGSDPVISSISRVLAGNRAIKLNNSASGAKVITMSKNYVINQNNFDFNYSVLLNDPGTSHPLIDKPFFLVRIYDLNDNILRSINVLTNTADCSLTASIVAGGETVLTTGWQCARINTANLIGQTVRLEFIISDCSQGGHFGTVYIDNICNSSCSNPLFGSIDFNQIPIINCPTTNQNICGTYQIPQNSLYSNISLNITQAGNIISTIPFPTTINTTARTFCFTVPPSAYGASPSGDYEFQVVGRFTRQCAVGFQLDPIYDNSANDLGADVRFTSITPTFNFATSICMGSIPLLPTNSANSPAITGTWNPPTITTSGNYTFTPAAGQCAVSFITKTITVAPQRTPTFTQYSPYCAGTAFILPSSSTNTPPITGTWSPAINNTATTTYTFTPTAGQCASTTTMTVVVNPINITINSQPIQYQKVCLNTLPQTLIVAATGNIVSHQWYQNNIPTSSFGATPIPWGTGAQFVPQTNTVGTIFYFVVIKNSTNCTVQSNIVQVTVANGTTNAGVLSGLQKVCIGSTTPFASTVSGGTWSSSNPAIATVNATTGLITGVATGSVNITYTMVGALCNSSVIRTLQVVPNDILVTNNDVITVYQAVTTQTTIASCITNDTANGVLNPSGVTATQTNALITGITLNTNGTITILPSVLAGTYILQYKINKSCGQSNIGTITLTINGNIVTWVGGDFLYAFPCFENYDQTSMHTIFMTNNGSGMHLNGTRSDISTKVTLTPITPLPAGMSLLPNGYLKYIGGLPSPGISSAFTVRACPNGFSTGCVDITARAGTMVSIVSIYDSSSNHTDLNIRLNMNLNGSIKPFYCVGSPNDDCNIYDTVASTFNFCNTGYGTVTASDIIVSNIQYINQALANININATTGKFEKFDTTRDIGLNHNLSTATSLNLKFLSKFIKKIMQPFYLLAKVSKVCFSSSP
jgi:Bacterial Ig-like domain (group 2)